MANSSTARVLIIQNNISFVVLCSFFVQNVYSNFFILTCKPINWTTGPPSSNSATLSSGMLPLPNWTNRLGLLVMWLVEIAPVLQEYDAPTGTENG